MEGKERGEEKKGGEERGEGNTRLTYISKENAKIFSRVGFPARDFPGLISYFLNFSPFRTGFNPIRCGPAL